MIKRRKLIVVLNALYLSFIKKNTLIKSKEFPLCRHRKLSKMEKIKNNADEFLWFMDEIYQKNY